MKNGVFRGQCCGDVWCFVSLCFSLFVCGSVFLSGKEEEEVDED